MKRLLRATVPAIAALLCQLQVHASDLLEVLPLTGSILMLHFDDGYVSHYGYHQKNDDDRIFKHPLDVARATHIYAYLLSSEDDPAYRQPAYPVKTGRKSKPMDISGKCLWTGTMCDNDYILEHWIYLQLPEPLKKGMEYTLWVGGLADNLDEVSFTYNESELRSELIHVNQHGYRPSARMKYAYLAHWAGDFGETDLDHLAGNSFYLMDVSDRSTAYQGTVQTRRRALGDDEKDFSNMEIWGTTNNFYGSDVWEVDFSGFSVPGEYILVVEGVGHSFPFKLDENIYREAYYHTTRGLYYQRAGIAKEEAFAGRWAQPRDHHPADGNLILYSTWPSMKSGEGSPTIDSVPANVVDTLEDWGWGWYHDAGDWDGYVHHTEVPYQLLVSYEMAPQNHRDHELNIPESGNGIPDLLDEAAWLINYFRRNQRPSGGVPGGRISADFSKKSDGVPSYEDERTWYLSGEDPHTSYLFAGLATQYAYCLELAGITDSTPVLLSEAQAAYQWASENHEVSPDGTVKGANLNDLRMYAAANLFKLTGEAAYQDDFIAENKITSGLSSLTGSGYDQTKAVWSFATCPNHPALDTTLRATLAEATIKHARTVFLDPAQKRSARAGYSYHMPPVVGSTTTPRMIPAIVAQAVAEGGEKQELIDYMHTTLDYYLGNNPLNMSWITGFGDRSPKRMLHLDSRYDRVEEYVPGLVPYGPNRHGDHFRGEDAQGPWDADFAKIRSHPDRYSWPISEMWYDNPYSVLDGEFTVHQTNAPAAASYGFLCADTSLGFAPNELPVITLTEPAGTQSIDESDSLRISVDVSDDERVAFVEYYLGHHLAGRMKHAPFTLVRAGKDLPEGSFGLSAIAFDNEGGRTKVTGDSLVVVHRFQPSVFISPPTDSLVQGQSLDVTVDAGHLSGVTPETVRLFLNGIFIGQDEAAPFEFSVDSILPLYNEFRAEIGFREGFTASGKLVRYAVPGVASVRIKKKLVSIHSGEYHFIEYEIIPAEALNRKVLFQTLDDSIASVDATGQIAGLAEGSARIVVTTDDGGFTDTAFVTVLPRRQPGPYHGEAFILPSVIEAEDFDLGGEGFAYHDLTQGNMEGEYRSEDVDLGATFDEEPAIHLTGIQAGEWTSYTVYVPETNLYSFRFRYTAGSGDARVLIKAGGEALQEVTLPGAGWYPFTDHIVEDVFLEEGKQVLTLFFTTGNLTLNYMEISCAACTAVLPRDIYLNYHDARMAVGGELQLLAPLDPPATTNKKVFWKSLNDSIVFVDPSGKLTALQTGMAKIVALSEARSLTDTCTVRVVEGSEFTPGLTYEYFEGQWQQVPGFAGMTPLKSGNTGNFDLAPAEQEDHFGFRFYGEILISQAGTWSFFTKSDDGSLLYVDGARIVDNDGLHAAVEQGGTIELDSGRHQIEVMYFEKGGGSVLEVSYQGPGTSKAPIPDSILGTWITGGALIPLQGISLPDTLTIPLLTSVYPEITCNPVTASDKKVTLSIADREVAAQSEFGYITGVAAGTTTLMTVSRDGGFTDSAIIRVINDQPWHILIHPVDDTTINSSEESIFIQFEAKDSIGGIRNTTIFIDGEAVATLGAGENLYSIPQPEPGTHFLYLQSEDMHGLTGISDTVAFTIRDVTGVNSLNMNQPFSVSITPNPFSNDVQFRVLSDRASELVFCVYGLTGRRVFRSGTISLEAGINNFQWDGKGQGHARLLPGVYFCVVTDRSRNRDVILKLIKE